MVTAGVLPFRENSHGRAGNRNRDLMISSQKLRLLDHEAGRQFDIYNAISTRIAPCEVSTTSTHAYGASELLRKVGTSKPVPTARYLRFGIVTGTVFKRVLKIAKSGYWLPQICPSVRLPAGSQRTDFH
jgi:hypothetical protein